uniref:Uncharacterized protein n=1 Tax=Opuntia streptacantha TaxID=393608 RepID=A0A7C9DI37_OPUST
MSLAYPYSNPCLRVTPKKGVGCQSNIQCYLYTTERLFPLLKTINCLPLTGKRSWELIRRSIKLLSYLKKMFSVDNLFPSPYSGFSTLLPSNLSPSSSNIIAHLSTYLR